MDVMVRLVWEAGVGGGGGGEPGGAAGVDQS